MKKVRLAVVASAALMVLTSVPSSSSTTPLESGLSRLGTVPGAAAAVDMAVIGKRLFVLTSGGLLAYDISTPASPALAGRLELPARRVGNSLQVAPSGDRAIVRDFGTVTDVDGGLAVIDVARSTEMRVVSRVAGFDEAPFCLAGCRWVLGSQGSVVDLRRPAAPSVVAVARTPASWVRQAYRSDLSVANVREVRPGLITTAPVKGTFDDRRLPILALDVTDPRRPRVAASATSPSDRYSFPDAVWPDGGRSRYQLVQSLFNGEDLFCTNPAPLLVYDRGSLGTSRFVPTARYTPRRGTYVDGHPAASPRLSCGGGQLDLHPAHRSAGGLVAAAELEHGIRVLQLTGKGRLVERAWALTPGGSAAAALWAADGRTLFALDESLGVEVLDYTGAA